jgi:hypothetical protein
MSLPALNTNIIIIAALLGGGFYGLLAGKQRVRILILSIYVGIVLAEQFAPVVAPVLSMLGADQVGFLLLGLPIVIFGILGGDHKKVRGRGAAIANIIIGILAGALIVSSALHLMPTSEMAAADSDSFIAMILQQYHLYILGFLPLAALVFGLMKGEKHH